jgi:AAA+ superfamily predicted ATPase
MNSKPSINELFEPCRPLPDLDVRDRLARLVGLDEQKSRLAKILGLLINPTSLRSWASEHHPDADLLLDTVLRRPPLVVLAGDVGSGKTELAETIGDAVARQQKVDITLLPLSLSTRGQGRVGEMTQLVTAAFDAAIEESRRMKGTKASGGVLLLVDEADALAQSRESSQMHHEDRAGVNAFIRGIDRMAVERLPAAVLMCTNRLNALDPAVRRRATDILTFSRPNDAQRAFVLEQRLGPVGFAKADITRLVMATGPASGGAVGFTFSDLTQRLIPSIVLDAYPSAKITPARALEIALAMQPTPPFRDHSGATA